MITKSEFEKLIIRPESSTIDFKKELYNFRTEKEKATADFVKDIISFSNTIRESDSYIIIGVEEDKSGKKIMHGISDSTDDAILQDKVKEKVFPRPTFHYYTYEYNNLTYGIIHIPITKYATPIIPSVKMKGLEIGKVYYRKGSSNSEALGLEVIKINEWLKSLPDITPVDDYQNKINEYLRLLTDSRNKVSSILTDLLHFAKINNIGHLKDICTKELKGITYDTNDFQEKHKYRIQTVFISHAAIQLNPYANITESMLLAEMERNDDFQEIQMFIPMPISEIETHIERIVQSPKTLIASTEFNSKQMFPDLKEDYIIRAYLTKDNISNLYQNIRQKIIDILVEL